MANQCCENCTNTEMCGNVLDILTKIAGHDIVDHCECECEENKKRISERDDLHANPDIDTSEAESEVVEVSSEE